MRGAIGLLAALSLAACATGNARQIAEKADTDASLAYAAIATSLNAYEAAHPEGAARAEAIKLQAWQALMAERAAYDAGAAVDLTPLTALAVQARALGG